MRNFLLLLVNLVPFWLFGKNIALVTVVIGSSYHEATLPGIKSKQEYCRLHGYDFICYTESIDPLRPHAWQKIKAVQKELENYDWIFWSDADSIVMNNKIPLEDYIDENYSFIVCFDNVSHVVNSGQFLIKNTPDSFEFLRDVYNRSEFINHPWWENAAIIALLNENKFSDSFAKVLPQRTMNSFAYEVCGNNLHACYQPNDFIIHFPSIRGTSKLGRLMKKYYDRVH